MNSTMSRSSLTTITAGVLGCGIALGTTLGVQAQQHTAAGTQSAPTVTTQVNSAYTPTAAELQEWAAMTATPAKRAEVITAFQESFAGVATVGFSDPTSTAGPTDIPATTTHSVSYNPNAQAAVIQPELATGWTRDHFWITASYADVKNGAIAGAVAACSTRIPAWVCASAGGLLYSWSSGTGYIRSHGVWAAIYNYGRIDGGRW